MAAAGHDGAMGRNWTAALAGIFLVAGVGGVIVFLTSEGLDRAEKWISISVGIGSLLLGAFGAVLAWKSWRQASTAPTSTPPASAPPASSSPGGVQISNSQGVQIGDRNIQRNQFGDHNTQS